MVHEIVADAAQDGAADSAHAARAHADHGCVLLLCDAADHLPRLTRRGAKHALYLEQYTFRVSLNFVNKKHFYSLNRNHSEFIEKYYVY